MKRVIVKPSPEAESVLSYLEVQAEKGSKIEKGILKAVKQKTELIKLNFHYGEPIQKKKIPKEYKDKYGITNLSWVGLPDRWRMLYSLINGETEIEIIAFILDIGDHKSYEKKFGYKHD